jgi:hypothetical protein
VVLQVDVMNTFNTISCNLPFFKSFKWQEASHLSCSLLFIPFMIFSFFCSVFITSLWEICLSSFQLWACVRVTPCWAFFYIRSFLSFALFFRHVSLLFFSLLQLITPISSTLPMLFFLFLIILFLNWLLWGWSFNLTSVWLGPLLVCLVGSPSQLVFVALSMTLGSWAFLLILAPSPHPFCKKLWMRMFVMLMYSQG